MNKLFITCSFLLLGSSLYGQHQDTLKDLPSEQVEVIKQFQARLEDARKLNIIPEPPAQRVLKEFDYNVNIRPILLEYPQPQIKPLPLPAPPKEKSFNGYGHLGIGNLNTIDGVLAYSVIANQDTEVGLAANYLYMNNPNEAFQKIQAINGSASISHYLSALATVDAKVDYHQKNVGFFGSLFDPLLSDTIYERAIIDYGLGFALSNVEENEFNVDYNINFEFKNISLLDEGLYENNFLVAGGISKDVNEQMTLNLSGIADISSITDTLTLYYNNYLVKPSLLYTTDLLSVDLGLTFAFTNARTYYLPQLEITYSAMSNSLLPYLFWQADLRKNNLIALLDYNPYLVNNLSARLDNSIYNKYGLGAKGNIQDVHYKAEVGYGKVDNLVLFRNTLALNGLRQFNIELDTSTILDINLEAQYTISNSLEVFAGFTYTDYSITAWHLPSYSFKASANYRLLNEKLTLSPSLFIRDGLTVLNDEAEIEELPYMLDLSIHVNYKLHKQISAFVELNNMLASEYQYWYDYSNFGFNGKIGLSAKF